MHTKTNTNKETHKQSGVHKTINQQQQNHRLMTNSCLSYEGGGGLKAFYWCQIFALDSVVFKTQKLFSSHGGFLTNTIQNHIETA